MPKARQAAQATSYNAPALEKGLDILELLSSVTQPMGLSEISKAVGREKSEIFRMLHVLERRHYLERTPGNDLYTLTNRLFLLGMERPPLKGLLDIALPLMHQLSDDTQQSCHLAVPSDEFMVVIARIDPPADLGLVVRIGHRRPILDATSGLVLTAFQPPEAQRRWIEDYGGGMSPKLRALLGEKLRAIRRKGYAAIRSSAVVGIVDVSVPILRSDIAVAALAIPYLKRTGAPVAQRDATVMLQKVAATIASKLA